MFPKNSMFVNLDDLVILKKMPLLDESFLTADCCQILLCLFLCVNILNSVHQS